MPHRPALSTVLAGAGALVVGLVVVVAVAQRVGGDPDPRGAGLPSAAPQLERVFAPDGALPADAPGLVSQLTDVTRRLRGEIEAWVTTGRQVGERPPAAVELLALRQQRLYLRLGAAGELGEDVVDRLPDDVRGEARNLLGARRALREIPETEPEPGEQAPAIVVGVPLPPGQLRRIYAAAEERSGVQWEVLAAVNLVESSFGRLRNKSTAGAQGPMQFIPSTWRQYGMGGDIEDPRDAILGAANYLAASGAPGDPRRALFAYNNSDAYVLGVLRHARAIERDPRHFYAVYSWAAYAERDGETKRLTGPGR